MDTKKLLLFPLVGILAACGNTSTMTGSSTSSIDLTIQPEDQVRPETTELDYTDYSTLGTAPKFDETKWYRNDLRVPLPDPFVIEEGNDYFIYGTTDRTSAKTLDCYQTSDFNTYTLYPDVYKPATGWGKHVFFAPEITKFGDTYYLYTSDEDKVSGIRYITVLTSDSPTGPFVEYQGNDFHGNPLNGKEAPIFQHNKSIGLSVLDQNLLVEEDGSIYMYYSVYDTGIMQYIVGVKMLDPVTADWDTYKILIRPGELTPDTLNTNILKWEAYKGFKVAEAPEMIKSPIDGKYYLTYSVNHFPDRFYTVCYAVSDTPLGDYIKPYTKNQTWTNLFFGYAGGMTSTTVHEQWGGFMSGTAHHCFFKVGNQYMIGYHAHKNRKDSNQGRAFGMDYVYFDQEGVPYTHGPTYSIQPLPEKINGYKNIALNATVKSINIEHPERINDNVIVEHYNLPQEADNEVTVKAGKSFIELVFDQEYSIGGINVYNSAQYAKALLEIDFINFYNGNAILSGSFSESYLNHEEEFIFPGSAFTFDFEDIKATRVIIGFNNAEDLNLNEINILGRLA